MNTKKYIVNIYYSTFCSYEIEADNEEEAYEKAKEQSVNKEEIISNIEEWNEANTIEEIYED
ncbi:MAG: hypothetical protein Q3983_05880 [Capnocytophaga sp.]|nr:hypothetical protein [Capnocytophaga sp.]